MVDVTEKDKSFRIAKAEGFVKISQKVLSALGRGETPKGNVLTTAKIAGIQGAKRTADMIPLCHPLEISWVDIQLRVEKDQIRIEAVVKTKGATGVEMEALTAVSIAALTLYDMCKAIDKNITITGIRLIEKKGGKSDPLTDYRPWVGVIVLSDSIHAGEKEDRSGNILREGFKKVGCRVDHSVILPDGSGDLEKTVQSWISEGIELVITSGGTGVGPRDLTIPAMEKLFEARLPGVEQALHAYGQSQIKTAMLSRLAVGIIGNAIVICLPGSRGAAKDALTVLIPSIFHAYPVMHGKSH